MTSIGPYTLERPSAYAEESVADTGSRTPRRSEKRAAKTAVGCLEEVSPDSGSG